MDFTARASFKLIHNCFLLHRIYRKSDSGVPRGEVGVSNPLPKFWKPSKIVPNSIRFLKLLKIVEFRKPTPQDVRKKGSKIPKLPPVRNCFTLAMTNKLVVIINRLKVPKIKKILLYEMKFLVTTASRFRFYLSSVLSWICWPSPRKKFLGTPLTSEKVKLQSVKSSPTSI